MAYTATGPFSNGGAPGISAAFLNAVEAFLVLINSAAIDSHISADGAGVETSLGLKLNTAAGTLTGSTSGSITWFEPLQGSALKVFIARMTNFRNNGGSAQNIVLPVAFTNRSEFFVHDTPTTGIQFLLSASAQNVSTVTGLSSSGGTKTQVTNILGPAFGQILAGFDTVSIPSGGSGTTDGILLIIGF